jgi:hypothetical protein
MCSSDDDIYRRGHTWDRQHVNDAPEIDSQDKLARLETAVENPGR